MSLSEASSPKVVIEEDEWKIILELGEGLSIKGWFFSHPAMYEISQLKVNFFLTFLCMRALN